MTTNPLSLIPPEIVSYWQAKYGEYLGVYITKEFYVFVENGRLDCFYPSGDRLAKHQISTGQTLYFLNNNINEPLTEIEYLIKLVHE